MLRTCSCGIALTAMVAGPTAQAADATLTLACKGTATIRADSPLQYKPHPLSMGLIVNFTTRTVDGTARQRPYIFDDQLQIAEWNEVTVIFRGFSQFLGMNISGSMDRHDRRCGYAGDLKNGSNRLLAEMHANTTWRRRIIACRAAKTPSPTRYVVEEVYPCERNFPSSINPPLDAVAPSLGPVVACAIARHAHKVTSTSAAGSSARRHQVIGRLREVLARVGWRRSISGAGGHARAVFRHARKLGQGIASKRHSPYRSGRSPDWLKMKNPTCEAGGEEDERRDDQSTTPAHAGTWP